MSTATLNPADLSISTYPPAPGFGMTVGMARGVTITHKPTGLSVSVDSERSQHRNRDLALTALAEKLAAHAPIGVAEPADLHNAIMNIKCAVPEDANVHHALSYKYGHRDARHAAAKLVSAAIAASQAASHSAEPVTVEAVATVIDTPDGLELDWLIEGGIEAMVAGQTLLISGGAILTDDTGSGKVYLAPVGAETVAVRRDLLNRVVERLSKAQIFDFSSELRAALASPAQAPDADWGAALLTPSGLTWGEIEAGAEASSTEAVTREMIEAGARAARECFLRTGGNSPEVIYRAMRAATPVQPVPAVGAEPIYAVVLDGKRIATASLRENADHAAHTSPGAVVVPCQLVPLAAAPASAVQPSPTAGMSMAQRILHVGGRNNAAGYVEFGSTQAVEALVRQVLRDAAAQARDATPAEAVERIVFLREQRDRRIYIAGPMTGLPGYNFDAFNAKAAELRAEGWHVENPAEHGHIDGAGWADYLRWDISRIATCGAIFLLPGWQDSKGASLEVVIGKALGVQFLGEPVTDAAPLAWIVECKVGANWVPKFPARAAEADALLDADMFKTPFKRVTPLVPALGARA